MSKRVVCPHGCGKEWTGTTNRRAGMPLNKEAVAEANRVSAANCERLRQPDGSSRELTMSADDYHCRRVWMDAYLEALKKEEKKEKKKDDKRKVDPPPPEPDPEEPVLPCQQAYLSVQVVDFEGNPVPSADVNVEGRGGLVTGQDGFADYGEVPPGRYQITAEKENHRPAEDMPVGPAETSADVPACQSTVVPLQLGPAEVILRENIIFIGSEQHYNQFWWKMMFIAAAYVEASKGEHLRPADKNTIAYVDDEYTFAEKLTLDFLREKWKYNIVKIASSDEVVNYMNERKVEVKLGRMEKTLLQDVVFFCHGIPHQIKINYKGSPDVNFTEDQLKKTKKDIFVPDGKIVSYACRTGIGDEHYDWNDYDDDADAEPQNSLAQKIADHFQVQVYALLRRSLYRFVIRDPDDSTAISDALKKARETQEGRVISLPPEHEGLPHPGLSDSRSARKEGVNDYALWRKAGGRSLPISGEMPRGVTAGLHLFEPR